MNRCELSACLDVEDLQPFYFYGTTYRVSRHGRIQRLDSHKEWVLLSDGNTIYEIIKHRKDLEKQTIYSTATIEAAMRDKHRFETVERTNTGTVFLTADSKDFISIEKIEYPEVKPGECVALREILKNTEVIRNAEFCD